MTIRKASKDELEIVYTIVQSTISKIYPHYYPQGAVNFFSRLHTRETILHDITHGLVFCSTEMENGIHETVTGTVTINKNEINRLFVLPEFQKKGIGTQLINFAEQSIMHEYTDACLHASFAAKSMYLKRGYRETVFKTRECDDGDFLCIDIMSKCLL